MDKSGTGKVCPYCEGKGHVSVVVDLPPADDPYEGLNRTTWVRKACPLCDGKGRISGDDSTPPKKPLNGYAFLTVLFVPHLPQVQNADKSLRGDPRFSHGSSTLGNRVKCCSAPLQTRHMGPCLK